MGIVEVINSLSGLMVTFISISVSIKVLMIRKKLMRSITISSPDLAYVKYQKWESIEMVRGIG